MAEIKFTGVNYDYNNIVINVKSDVAGVSRIGVSGVTIGSAADYDRISGLAPTVAKINDAASSIQAIGCPVIASSKITIGAGAKTITLTKKGKTLNYKVTT